MSDKYSVYESIILTALKPYHEKEELFSMDVILASAYEFVEHFRKGVTEFIDSGRDKRKQPPMKQTDYIEVIANILYKYQQSYDRVRREPIYEVYFISAILMGTPDHRHSWWENTFALRVVDYLEKTRLFGDSRVVIHSTLKAINAQCQYEIDFYDYCPAETQTTQVKMQNRQNEANRIPKITCSNKKSEVIFYIDSVGQLSFGDLIENQIVRRK